MVGVAVITVLRADLHELAADFHELAAAIHDWRADEHRQALRHSVGDPIHHQLQVDLRQTAAAAERASAQKERELRRMAVLWSAMRAERDRGHPGAAGIVGMRTESMLAPVTDRGHASRQADGRGSGQ